MRIRNPKNYITFTCEAKGCENVKTLLLSEYNTSKTHTCSHKCRGALYSQSKIKSFKNHTSFICEAEGCKNVKTVLTSKYVLYDTHTCCVGCRGDLKAGRGFKTESKPKLSIKEQIALYWKEKE